MNFMYLVIIRAKSNITNSNRDNSILGTVRPMLDQDWFNTGQLMTREAKVFDPSSMIGYFYKSCSLIGCFRSVNSLILDTGTRHISNGWLLILSSTSASTGEQNMVHKYIVYTFYS